MLWPLSSVSHAVGHVSACPECAWQQGLAAEGQSAQIYALVETSDGATAEELQNLVYEIGKDPHYGFAGLRDWFKALYETLLGSSQGPRMGSFIALYGIAGTRRLIAEALEGVDLPAE